jgi:hypothetical protein
MDEYKPNSHKFKESQQIALPEKKVGTAIAGAVRARSNNPIQRLAGAFISEDVGDIKSYILLDILIPAIKDAVWDLITNGSRMVLFGENGRPKSSPAASKISYNRYYGSPDSRRRGVETSMGIGRAASRSGLDYDDILFQTRGDAEAVIDAMNEIVGQYGVVSIGDLYDLADLPTDNYAAANKYGWTDIRGCKPIRVRDGYILKLPRALPLN